MHAQQVSQLVHESPGILQGYGICGVGILVMVKRALLSRDSYFLLWPTVSW